MARSASSRRMSRVSPLHLFTAVYTTLIPKPLSGPLVPPQGGPGAGGPGAHGTMNHERAITLRATKCFRVLSPTRPRGCQEEAKESAMLVSSPANEQDLDGVTDAFEAGRSVVLQLEDRLPYWRRKGCQLFPLEVLTSAFEPQTPQTPQPCPSC